jgi:uncharacterized protein
MKSLQFILLFIAINFSFVSLAQTNGQANAFHGAEATWKEYKALYILNESDDKKIRAVIRNINNALEDPRLKGKLQVELIAFGDGVELYKKSNHYDTMLTVLQSKAVILAQCENTLKERKISKDELWPFVAYVHSGNGEIIIRQYQGWAVVHP